MCQIWLVAAISDDVELDKCGMELVGSNWKIGKGNGNPLQYSCLENPMNGGAW